MEVFLQAIGVALSLFWYILLARILLSWFPNIDPNSQIVRILYDLTEPVLRPIRGLLPTQSGVDFSPMIVMLAILLLRTMIGI